MNIEGGMAVEGEFGEVGHGGEDGGWLKGVATGVPGGAGALLGSGHAEAGEV
jgi:hypothetical protein